MSMEKRRQDRSPNNNEKKRERNEDEPDTSKLFVGNLSDRTKEDDLVECFKKYGKIRSVRIITDPTNHRSKGYGFVTMEDPRDGDIAQKETNNKIEIDGRFVVVEIAKGRDKDKRTDRNERYEPNEKRTRRSDHYEPSREDSYRHERYPEDYRDRRALPMPPSRYSDYPPFPVPLPGEYPIHMMPYGKEDPRYSGWIPRRDYRESAPLPPSSYPRRDERDLLRGPPVMYPPPVPYPEDYYRVSRVTAPPPHHSLSSERSHWDSYRDSRDYHERDYRDEREHRDVQTSHHHREWDSRSSDRNKERDNRDSRDHHKDRNLNSNDRKTSRDNENGKEKDRDRSKPKDRMGPSHHKSHS